MYFSIAEQSVTLPDGQVIHFRVNRADSSQVEIHVSGKGPDGVNGVNIVTFNRNGGHVGLEFRATLDPARPRTVPGRREGSPTKDELDMRADMANRQIPLDANRPLDEYKTVDEDAVRGDPRRMGDPNNPVDAYGNALPVNARNPDGTPYQSATGNSPDGRLSATGEAKVSPVHGKINTVGMDAHAGRPPEGTNADTPAADPRAQASVGLKPAGT